MALAPALSTWLDLLRLGAAVVVFLGHAATQRVSGGLLYQFGRHGEAAVDVFFVVSGFVIAHAVQGRGLRDYAVARVARVYSVVLPCLALGWLLDAAGPRLGAEVYAAAPNFAGPADAGQLVSSLLFLDHLWFRAAQPGTNLPFWSLAFEAWYYVAFGLIVFAPAGWRWPAVALVLVAAGPKIALLFPLWLLGVACRRVCVADRVPARLGWVLLLAPLAGLAAWDSGGRDCYPFSALVAKPACLLDLRHDYAVGLMVAVHLVGVQALAPVLWPWLRRWAGAVAWLAGASFTLYLLHYPLIHFIAAATPWPEAHGANRVLVFLVPPLAALAVAEVTERRRMAWRRAVAALLRGRRTA